MLFHKVSAEGLTSPDSAVVRSLGAVAGFLVGFPADRETGLPVVDNILLLNPTETFFVSEFSL